MNKCLMIVGMHRSGTSLLFSIFQKSGLYIGDELMAASKGNRKGYFENIDFCHFHATALESLSLDSDGWDLQSIKTLNHELDKKATEIIQEK